MKDFWKETFGDDRIFGFYYIIVILGYVATLFFDLARPGIIAAVLMCIAFILLLIRKNMNIRSIMDVLIVVCFFYKALTVICIIRQGLPLSVYFGEAFASLVPMIFYFVGRIRSDRPGDYYKKFLYALFILGAVSILLYITAPGFYCDYLYKWSYISKADASTMRVRMQSVTGSTLFGAMNVYGMLVSIYFICSKEESVKGRKSRIFGLIAFLFTFACAVFSNQRSAMVCAIIVIAYLVYLAFIKFGNINRKYLVIGIIAAAVLALLVCFIRFDFVLKVWYRISSLPGAVSERSEQWIAAVNNMYSSWFGNGLGANGHRALGIEGTHVIADGGLIKMYCEEGVLGFSLFVYIVFLSLKKSAANIGRSFTELGIVIAALLMSTGSNILAFQLATPLFWFAIGRIHMDPEGDELISFRKKGEGV